MLPKFKTEGHEKGCNELNDVWLIKYHIDNRP